MRAPLKDQWIEQCARRLMELQPVLRPRVAALAAKDLWDEEQGIIPPERRAYLEVVSWGCRPKAEIVRVPQERGGGARRAQTGRISLDWCLDFALMLCTVVGILTWPW
ncbi:MAG: hypothetical protein C0487_02855 [Leptothrix sp. (in: Bacteria)]|nr:hypothetical protein [Leptothrix sp. (in: b-proteobacteria)]